MSRTLVSLLLLMTACAPGNPALSDPTPGVGESAVDGEFTFVVKSFECGQNNVTSGLFTHTADGHFCLLELQVTNIGDERKLYLAGAQGLLDFDGRRLGPSIETTLLLNPDTVNKDLQPGISIHATVAFDVAEPDEIEFAQLRDAPFSEGVSVRLGSGRG